MKQRIASFVLAALMTAQLASCADGAPTPSDPELTNTVESTTEAEPAYEPPAKNFNGETFTILTKNDIADNELFIVEEENGEAINDALYRRNSMVEERYNLKLEMITTSSFNSQFESSVLADDNSMDFAFGSLNLSATALQRKELLYNLADIDTIHLENDYWNPRLSDIITNNQLYFAIGDISYGAYDMIIGLCFNKKLMEEYIVDDPYELVKSGKWTYTAMEEMLQDVTSDLNGDSVMNHEDRYGLLCGTIHSLVQYVGASGTFAETDGETISVSIGKPSSRDILDTILSKTIGSDNKCIAELITGVSDVWSTAVSMFHSDQGLFRSALIQDMRNSRDMVTDFGILPYPKYTEEQERYISMLHTSNGKDSCVMIPMNADNPEDVGFVVDTLCYYSTDTLMRAYYDVTLVGKTTRDDGSEEMLDLIFDGVTLDIGLIFNIGSVSKLIPAMAKNQINNFSSEYAKIENQVISDLDELNALYDKGN